MQQSQQQINSAGVKVNEVHPQPLTSIGKLQRKDCDFRVSVSTTVVCVSLGWEFSILESNLAISTGRILCNCRCIATCKVQGYHHPSLKSNSSELKIIFVVVVVLV